MSEEPDWAILLRELYERETARIELPGRGKAIAADDPLVGDDTTGLTRQEAEDAILYLKDSGLLVQGTGAYVLTNDGFTVAHERQMQGRKADREENRIKWQEHMEERRVREQNDINRALGFLTLGLPFINFIDMGVSVYGNTNVPQWGFFIALFLGAAVVSLITIQLFGTGLLHKKDSDTTDPNEI